MTNFNSFMNESKCKDVIKYNTINNLPLYENPYRPESEMFSIFFNYLRENESKIKSSLNEQEIEDIENILSTDIGYSSIFEDRVVFLDLPYIDENIDESSNGDVELNVPHRGGPKKFYVYVKNEQGNIVKVSFGAPGMDVKFSDPERRKLFNLRHKCSEKKDKTTPGYWSCNLPKYAKYLGLEGGGNFYW